MRKLLTVIVLGMLVLSMTGCNSVKEKTTKPENQIESIEETNKISVDEIIDSVENADTKNEEEINKDESKKENDDLKPEEENDSMEDSKILVAYFTYGENADFPDNVDVSSSASIQIWNGEVTGNAGMLAHMIAEYTGADLFSIQTTEKYPSSYEETVNQGKVEKEDNYRPELLNQINNLADYNTVFVGFPNWWSDLPMAMYSFFENHDFTGKNIILFSTSGGSGFSNIVKTIENFEPNSTIQEGITIGSSSVSESRGRVDEWLQSIGY